VAVKPTVYKLRLALSDLNRNYYDSLNLTIVQHPSETLERMMVRVMAFCVNSQQHLVFCKGLSTSEEPDIWARTLDGDISLWIEVGEPSTDRIKKATRVAQSVKVYCFNTKSDVWWNQGQAALKNLKVSVFRFQWDDIRTLTTLVQRTMDLSVTITGDSAYVAAENGECEVNWETLQVTG